MAILLVVVDDRLRQECVEKLHAARYRVTALGAEDEAQRYLRSFTPAVIVYHAAEDGEATRRFLCDLSVRESGPQIPIVVLSASGGTTRLAEACGCSVVSVPVDAARLCAELARLAPHSRRAQVG